MKLPSKFAQLRPVQVEAGEWLEEAAQSGKRFLAPVLPTGSGKSLVGVRHALSRHALSPGSRAVYLTATKGLQDQLHRDFAEIGMVDLRGKANYSCRMEERHLSCLSGMERGCSRYSISSPDCPYQHALSAAVHSPLTVTNYSWWLSNPGGLEDASGGGPDLLICDECHSIEQELARHLEIVLLRSEVDVVRPVKEGYIDREWRDWAAQERRVTVKAINESILEHGGLANARKQDSNVNQLIQLRDKLTSICKMADREWVWEEQEDGGYLFSALYPGRHAAALWQGIPSIVLISASTRPYTLELLGLKSGYEFREFPSNFPPNRGIVYYLPTVRLNWKSSEEDYLTLTDRIDEIISTGRLDRKGLIHTVSYKLMHKILQHTRYRSIMLYNDSTGDASRVVREHRSRPAPSILISPSFSTGYDFPGRDCEYQIIPKVPWPYQGSMLARERMKDEEYRIYSAVLEVTQMCGRGMRFHQDRCESIILDTSFPRLMAAGRRHAPAHFKYYKVAAVPKAPPRLAA